MGSTGLESCEHCGRMRWAADRFCAECGEEFAEQRTTELQEFDADALTPATPLENDDDPTSRFPRPFVVAAGSLIGLLALLGLFAPGTATLDDPAIDGATGPSVDLAPMSGFGGSPTVTPVPQFGDPEQDLTNESGLPVTPVPPRPDPATLQAADAETSTKGATSAGNAQSEPDPASSDLARSALLDHILSAELDLGAEWIATLTDDHRPRVVHVDTGDQIVLDRTNQFGAPVFFTEQGTYSVGVSGEDESRSSWFSFQPWSGSDTTATKLVGGDFVGAYRDPDRGTVVVSAAADGASAGQALDLDGAQSARVDLLGGQTIDPEWAKWTHPSFGDLDHIAAGSGGAVWIWTWDQGWERWGAGEVVVTGRDERVIRQCQEGFDSCDVSVSWAAHTEKLGAVPINGSWRIATHGDSTSTTQPELLALSGDVLLSGESSGGATMISLWDLDEGSITEIGLDVDEVFWMDFSPNGRYLFVSSSTGTSVIDAASGDLVLVNRRAAGAINGLSPSPLVFLDEIER